MAGTQAQNGQVAICIKVVSTDGSDGKKYTNALMRLGGDEHKSFELPVTKWFIPQEGKTYFPTLDVKTVARISERTGRAYTKEQVIIHWTEVK